MLVDSRMHHSNDRRVWLLVLSFMVAVGGTGFAAGPFSLQWQQGVGFRVATLPVPSSGKTGFSLQPSAQTGVAFTNSLPLQRGMTNLNLYNGSGLALGDYDADGLCDLYLCNLNGTNALYRNLGGWKFLEVTAEAGASCPGQTSTGAVFADID